MVHDKTGPDRKKLDRRNARQQPIKFKDSGFRTGKMLKKKIKELKLKLTVHFSARCAWPARMLMRLNFLVILFNVGRKYM